MFDNDYMLINEKSLAAAKVGDALRVEWITAYPQVFKLHVSKKGTSLTAKIQGSEDGSSWSDVATFTAPTEAGAEYLRVLTPYKYIRGNVTAISGDWGDVLIGLVPAGEYEDPA